MKLKLLLFSVLWLGLIIDLAAQTYPWNAFFGNEGAEFAYDIKQTQDDGYIIAAYGNNGGSSDFYVVKLDLNGELEWEKTISKDAYSERAFSILETDEGDYIVVGNATNWNKPWLVKLNALGDTLWTTQWTDTVANNSGLLARGTLLSDGRIVVVGHEDYSALDPQMFIVSQNGDLIEEVDLEPLIPLGWYSGTVINDIEPTNDGGFILTGATGGGTGSRAYLWKFNDEADSVWSVIYDGPEMWMRSASSVKQLNNGDYILTGFTAPNSTTTAVLRADSDGNFMWYQSYPDTIYTQGTDVIEWKSGEFLISEKRFSGFGSNFFQSALLRINSQGELLARDQIMASDSSTTITQMRLTADGGFVMAGEINEYLWVGEQDLFVLKSDSLGNIDNVYIDYVWPGDVNYDGVVNMNDLMILGVTAGGSGPQRWDTTINWFPHYVTDWADTVVTGVNFKHADTDGNGVIDQLDTLAISANFGKTHEIPSKSSLAINGPELWINPTEATLDENYFVHIPLYIGYLDNVITDLYGLQFEVSTDAEFVVLEQSKLNMEDGWLVNNENSYLDMVELNENTNKLSFGFTKIDHQQAEGFGHIGYLILKLDEETVNPGEELLFSLSFENAVYNNYILESIGLMAEEYLISLNTTTTGMGDNVESIVRVYPNPVIERKIYIESASTIESLKLYSIDGQGIDLDTRSDQPVISIPVNLPPGIYFLSIQTEGIRIQKKLIIK